MQPLVVSSTNDTRGTMTLECTVCFEPTEHVLWPCGHHMCPACTERWWRRSTTCPVCRQAFLPKLPNPDPCHVVILRFSQQRDHAGIRLTRHRGGKLRVTWLHCQDLSYRCGLRKGDVVTHINGVQVSDPDIAVRMLDVAKAHGIDVHVQRNGDICVACPIS